MNDLIERLRQYNIQASKHHNLRPKICKEAADALEAAEYAAVAAKTPDNATLLAMAEAAPLKATIAAQASEITELREIIADMPLIGEMSARIYSDINKNDPTATEYGEWLKRRTEALTKGGEAW